MPFRATPLAAALGLALGLALPGPAAACPTTATPGPGFGYTGAELWAGQAFSATATGGSALSSCGIPGAGGHAADIATMSLSLTMMDGYALTIDVQSDCDSTLLVNAADGTWIYNDDGGDGLMPRIVIAEPWRLNGRVDVWIGTWGGGSCPATITFRTGLAPGLPDEAGDVPFGAGGCPDPSLHGVPIPFTGAQLRQPQRIPVEASGAARLADCAIPGTRGHANAAPSYSFALSGMQGMQLALTAEADCDTILLVHSPDGQWHFNDDGHGNLDPALTLMPPTWLEGRVDVWVGTYGPTACPAALTLQALGGGAAPVPPPQPQPQAPGLAGTWTLNANGFTGTLSFAPAGGGWSGVLTLDRGPEPLQAIRFDPASGRVEFLRPIRSVTLDGTQRVQDQHYVGTVSGNGMAGQFNQAGGAYQYAWSAGR